ncbi:hypothetical protein I552_3099, partial [Mycobacterium xenopi 3993]
RTLYHAALAHGSNHLVTVLADALQALRPRCLAWPGGPADGRRPAGWDRRTNHRAMAACAGKHAGTGSVRAHRTGSRGDAAAVAEHLAALADVAPELAEAYRANALRTAHRAHAPTTS